MFKTAANMLIGALIAASVSAAFAVTGFPPVNGFQTPDGTWLLGLSQQVNSAFQSGLVGAGSTQAGCLVMPALTPLVEFDTVASGTGGCLPPALAGTEIAVYNNGANQLTLYPSLLNTTGGAQDTINNTTTLLVASHTSRQIYSAKNGIWAAQ